MLKDINMKKSLILIPILFAVLIFSLNLFSQSQSPELSQFAGKIKNIGGEWYLNTGEDFFKLNLPPQDFLTENEIELVKNTDIVVNGLLSEDDEIVVYSFTYDDIELIVIDADGNRLWETEEVKQFYTVDSSKCIGCRLCVSKCPTDAISMVNGKAVIDADKCIACGICANGDGQKWKGCPVKAINLAE